MTRRQDVWCRFRGGPRGWYVSIGRDGDPVVTGFASADECQAFARFLMRRQVQS